MAENIDESCHIFYHEEFETKFYGLHGTFHILLRRPGRNDRLFMVA
jgi:hypothetical protein